MTGIPLIDAVAELIIIVAMAVLLALAVVLAAAVVLIAGIRDGLAFAFARLGDRPGAQPGRERPPSRAMALIRRKMRPRRNRERP